MNLAYAALAPEVPPPDPDTLQRAIALDPGNARLHRTLGIALLLRNDIDGATASMEQSLSLAPADARTHCSLGQIHLIRNELEVARASFEQAIALDPDDADAHAQLAVIRILDGQAGDALRMLSERVQRRPDVPLLWANLAAARRVTLDAEGAIAAYRRALVLQPAWINIRGDLAAVLFQLGRFSEAVAERRRLAELQPDSAEALNDFGGSLVAAGELGEAVEAFERAAELHPDWSVPLHNAGAAACALRKPARAAGLFRRIVAHDPKTQAAHTNLGMMSMQLGDFGEGLREYEWRWPANGATYHRPELQVPLWDGEPLAGRALFVWWEQGRGDIIQFARFLSRIPKDGGRIILHAPPKLARLLATVEGVDQVVTDGEWLDADVQFPLLSLPFALGVTLEGLGETRYLRAPEPVAAANARIPCGGSALNVGCVWASGTFYEHHRRRDCDVHAMAGLASVPGIRLFSLQWGERAPDAEPYADRMTDLSDVLGDFGTTAAFVERLDLIVTVDTVMAHLAGALGKPVWLLLNHRAEWRWMDDRCDSPWYPTIRIYRQSREGDWSDVFERVGRDLAELARRRGCTRAPRPPLEPSAIPRTALVKQYGERRTGTNFLRRLLGANYHAEVLMHILGDKHSPPVPFDDYWRDAQCEPNPARAFVCRATFSAPSLTTTPYSLRQIAEVLHFEAPIAEAFTRDALCFVISIRDPYAWAASLGWFLGWSERSHPMPDERAEELRLACLQFNARYAAWMELAERLPSRAFFVRYEHLLANPESVCERLAHACGLVRRSRRWRNQEETVLPAIWDTDPTPYLGPKFDPVDSILSPSCHEVVAKTIDWPLVDLVSSRATRVIPSEARDPLIRHQ